MMIEQLYDALLAAGAPEPQARDAAKAVADFQESVHRMEMAIQQMRTEMQTPIGQMRTEMQEWRGELKLEVADIRHGQNRLTALIGVVLTLLVPLFYKVFTK